MLIIFWLLFALVAYIYAGYPLLVISGLLGRKLSIDQSEILPLVSVIVPAHNEANNIEQKLQNILQLDYPPELLEILVGSDGSTDATDEIVHRYADRGVRLISRRNQRGKSSIQNDIVESASGTILLFTDADCNLSRNALRSIIPNFADPSVGLVTVGARYSNADENEVTRNETIYLRYEAWLRSQESERGFLAVGSGALFAMRRSLWQPLDGNVGDDFVLPLQVAIKGFRNIIGEQVQVLTRLNQSEHSSIMKVRIRVISKDLRGLKANSAVLNPFRTGAVAISVWSHKLLRWMVPYFLTLMLVTNLFLLHSPLYWVLLCGQLAFYGVAIAGLSKLRVGFPWSVAASFCLVNFAALVGSLHFVRGGTTGRWKPAR